MLTATTETAIRVLVLLCQRNDGRPASPREITEAIGGSPTYLAKIAGLLRKAGIVRSHNGAEGGVTLASDPSSITLLDIVQACQGLVIADYCEALGEGTSPDVCAFHKAMHELHAATIRTLSRWNLKMLASNPVPVGKLRGNKLCRMAILAGSCKGCGAAASHRPALSRGPRTKAP